MCVMGMRINIFLLALTICLVLPSAAFGQVGDSATGGSFCSGEIHVGNTESASVDSVACGSYNTGDQLVCDVKIEGNRLIPTEEIAAVIKTRKGDKYDRAQVLSDLKAIDSMGYFNRKTLQVNPEVTPGGVLLEIVVEENAPVTKVVITGNSVVSTDELSRFFNDQLGRPSNLNALSKAISKVELAYRDRGFLLANVVDVKDDPEGKVKIVINEGTIADIVITGNKKVQDYVIRHALKLKPGSIEKKRD
jgi:outer membrane protein assembly factor BamA